jgi:hypothetical protein
VVPAQPGRMVNARSNAAAAERRATAMATVEVIGVAFDEICSVLMTSGISHTNERLPTGQARGLLLLPWRWE